MLFSQVQFGKVVWETLDNNFEEPFLRQRKSIEFRIDSDQIFSRLFWITEHRRKNFQSITNVGFYYDEIFGDVSHEITSDFSPGGALKKIRRNVNLRWIHNDRVGCWRLFCHSCDWIRRWGDWRIFLVIHKEWRARRRRTNWVCRQRWDLDARC